VEGFMNDKKREEGKWFTFLGEDWNQPFEWMYVILHVEPRKGWKEFEEGNLWSMGRWQKENG
jgi:hypothetical protein